MNTGWTNCSCKLDLYEGFRKSRLYSDTFEKEQIESLTMPCQAAVKFLKNIAHVTSDVALSTGFGVTSIRHPKYYASYELSSRSNDQSITSLRLEDAALAAAKIEFFSEKSCKEKSAPCG